jgi:hypothetical protein
MVVEGKNTECRTLVTESEPNIFFNWGKLFLAE